MNGKMQTYTGKVFDFENIENSEICIEDVAHALSLTCRYNGHVPVFYSVGEHSLMATHLALELKEPKDVCLQILLHDASEAYVNDIVRPAKKLIAGYKSLEDAILHRVYDELLFKLSGKRDIQHGTIKFYDELMLFAEKERFFPVDAFEWSHRCSIRAELVLATSKRLDSFMKHPKIIEQEFIDMYKSLI